MKNLFKKQSAKFVQNPSTFTKVMVKHILVCFYAPHCRSYCSLLTIAQVITAVAGSDSPEAVASTSAENTAAFVSVILSWNTFHFILFYFTLFYQTCQAGFVLSVTRILKAALAKFLVYVCMCVCVSTPPKPLNRFA